jgi:hypothetical protein
VVFCFFGLNLSEDQLDTAAGRPANRPTAEGYETRKSGYSYDITEQVNVVELVLSLRNKSVYTNGVASVFV